MKIMIKSILSLALAIPLAASLSSNSFASPDQIYTCDALGDGNYFVSVSTENPNEAYAVYSLGGDTADLYKKDNQITLKPEFTGNDFYYRGDGIQFMGVESTALLIDIPGKSVVQCRVELTQRSSNILNLAGYSLGGKVRSGPGLNFPQTGSVRGKEAITLLENSGVTMDGYDWFKVQRTNGDIGYQWGGILCSDNKSIRGIFEQCL